MRPQTILLALLIADAAMMAVFVAVPFIAPSGTALGLDGSVGTIDHPDIWYDMDLFSGSVYALGDFLCHQEEARSFILGDNQMPVCIRDFSLMIGAAVGLALCYWRYADVSAMGRNEVLVCLVLFALTPAEWALEGATGWDIWYIRAVISVVSAMAFVALLTKYVGQGLESVIGRVSERSQVLVKLPFM